MMMIWSGNGTTFISCLLLSLFAGLLCGMALKHLLKLDSIPKTACIGAAGTAVFLCIHGFTDTALMCAVVFQILLFASVYDIKNHTVPDYVHILIMSAGLLRFQPLPAFLGFILVPLPFFIAALRKENSVGGGDIKLMAACGFVLGAKWGFTALIFGLVMAVLWNAAYNKEKKEPFALAPYLTLGCFMALIQI